MRTVRFLIVLGLLSSPALAQAPPAAIFSGKVKPDGYCQLTSLNTAVRLVTASCATGSVPTDANLAVLIVEAQAIRFRTDGTLPTATIGMPLAIGNSLAFALPDLTQLRLIGQTSGAIVNVEFYK